MFLGSLTVPEQVPFLTLAKELISVDGEISEQEKNLLRHLAAEMSRELNSDYFSRIQKASTPGGIKGTVDSQIGNSMSREDAINAFQGRRSKASALFELIGIAYCDTSYDPDEKRLIEEIGVGFGFTEEEIIIMENWVLRQIGLMREAQEFFDAEVGA